MAGNGRRRPHGEGSVYKRGDGRWVGALNLGYVAGRRVRKTVYGKSQREVLQKMNDLRRAAETGRYIEQASPLLSTWLDEWLGMKAAEGTRPSTLRAYRWQIETHIKPLLGQRRLDKLLPSDVRALVQEARRAGLAPASLNHLIGLMRNTLGDAERDELVQRNVAKAVRKVAVPKRESGALDVPQARTILAAIRGHRLEALFATTLLLGLRRGEVLGLCWEDFDFTAGTVRIQRSLQRVEGSLQLVPVKTTSSAARLALPPSLGRLLAQHRARQSEARLALGEAWPGNDLVFTSTVGTPLEPRNVTREWDKVRRDAGLDHVRFHDLRHSCATILVALGVHPRVVMETLRHSTVGMTMDIYSHVGPMLQREAADALESALFG